MSQISGAVAKIKERLNSVLSVGKRSASEAEPVEIRADRYVKESGLAVVVPELAEIMEYWPHWAKRADAANWVPTIMSELSSGSDKVDGSWIEWRTDEVLFRISHEECLGLGDDEYRKYRVQADGREVLVFAAYPTDGSYGPWEYAFVCSLIVGPWIKQLVEFHVHAKSAAKSIRDRGAAENRAASAARFDLGD